MKRSVFLVVLIVAAVGVLLAAGLSAQITADRNDRAAHQQNWQHLALQNDGATVTGDPQLARQIDQLGRDGWELVDVEALTVNGNTHQTVFFFKRPR